MALNGLRFTSFAPRNLAADLVGDRHRLDHALIALRLLDARDRRFLDLRAPSMPCTDVTREHRSINDLPAPF